VRAGPLRLRQKSLEPHRDHEDLTELFGRYWERVLPLGRPGNLALPFFHLRGDGFWHLIPRHESTRLGSQIAYMSRLREEILGARLDEELFDLVRSEENRDRLRSVLIDAYFSPETRRPVAEQSAINRGAFFYSEELLRRPEDRRVEEALPVEEAYRPAVRDQGFRRAVVTASPSLRPVRHPRAHAGRTHGGRGGAHSSVERDA
jgi:putative restriction endonuclease